MTNKEAIECIESEWPENHIHLAEALTLAITALKLAEAGITGEQKPCLHCGNDTVKNHVYLCSGCISDFGCNQ